MTPKRSDEEVVMPETVEVRKLSGELDVRSILTERWVQSDLEALSSCLYSAVAEGSSNLQVVLSFGNVTFDDLDQLRDVAETVRRQGTVWPRRYRSRKSKAQREISTDTIARARRCDFAQCGNEAAVVVKVPSAAGLSSFQLCEAHHPTLTWWAKRAVSGGWLEQFHGRVHRMMSADVFFNFVLSIDREVRDVSLARVAESIRADGQNCRNG